MSDEKFAFVASKKEKLEVLTCLGLGFSSDEERREYFRNELRKKLPELKKIEGFPIGEDEDIIALSDPPYYTACPNPWLNDFIDEWEKGKETISGRKKDFKVDEPFATDVTEGKTNPIYTAHTYHTKVPHPAIMRYILHYTQPGDIVFDGFAGTGMTGVAAQLCSNPDKETKAKIDSEWKQLYNSKPRWGERKAICGELSPFASFIAYNYNSPTDLKVFENEANKLLFETQNECNWLYETKHSNGEVGLINYVVWSDVFICSNCGHEIIFWDAALDRDEKIVLDDFACSHCSSLNSKNSAERSWITIFDQALSESIRIVKTVPVYVVYTYQGKRFEKSADIFDYELCKKIDEKNIPHWFPFSRMPMGDESRRNDRIGMKYVHQFYTKRNLWALSILNTKINKSGIPNKLKFILTGMIKRSTKMNRIHVSNFFYGGGGWNAGGLAGTLYIPSMQVETSILEQISDKISSLKKAISFLSKNYSNLEYVASATQINLKDSSIDYIFTDPPFGANIMYSELNILPESWLKVMTNNIKEAIENKAQSKTLLDYQAIMNECFNEYYRILKPNKWLTVEFSNTSAAVWNGIQTALQRSGFIISHIAALDKKQGGMRSITTLTAVRQDLVITCYKPSQKFEEKFKIEKIDVAVWEFVREHLQHLPININNEEKVSAVVERSPRILFDRLLTFYLMRGLPIPIDAGDFQIGLKQKFVERDGMFFTPEQALEYEEIYEERKDSQYVLVFDSIYSESDAVLWLRERLQKSHQTYQEIMPDFRKANRVNRKGEFVAELKTVLEENFINESNGKWRVPNMNEAKDREALRNKSLLKEFDKYKDELDNPKTKKIKEVRVEALRAGFKMCWEKKDFRTIVNLGDKIPQNILLEDEQLLMYYDIAKDKI